MTMTTTLQYADVRAKRGAWQGFRVNADPPVIAFSCPLCGEFGTLDAKTVHPDGTVSEIMTCPRDCGWASAQVVLERWKK